MDGAVFKRIKDYIFTVSQGAVNLAVSLVLMILVERFLGEAALGTFSYLLSLYFIAAFVSELGIPAYLEREIALHKGDKAEQIRILSGARKAIRFSSILVAVIFIFSSLYDTSFTAINEKFIAYIFIGILIPIRNVNSIQVALFQATGVHDIAASLLIKKRVALVVLIFFMLSMHIPPSYLFAAFIISELYFIIASFMTIAKKRIQLPDIGTLKKKPDSIKQVIKKSIEYILTDEVLDIVFYVDFLILGLFVNSQNLGIYASASILARIFLLIPMSIKPIYRKNYCDMASRGDTKGISTVMHKTSSYIFFAHALMALYILLYYPSILQWLFHARGVALTSFNVFIILLPGLLFFSVIASQETVFEAAGEVKRLQRLVIIIACVNLCVNGYLVPFAGIYGAAFATTASMFLYYILFVRKLDPAYHVFKGQFVLGGLIVYIIYHLFAKLDLGFGFTFWLLPLVLLCTLYLSNFFNFKDMRLIQNQTITRGG